MEVDTSAILSVTGWTSSKASSNADQGEASLLGWLKHKSKRTVQNHQRVGDVIQIEVLAKDKRNFLHVDGWTFAGTNIKITEGQLDAVPQGSRTNSIPSGPRGGGFNQSQPRNGDLASRMTGGPNNNLNQNRNASRELFDKSIPSGPRGGSFQQNQQFNGNSPSSPFGQTSKNPFSQTKGIQSQQQPDKTESVLIEVMRARYNAADKFLDLTALALDPRMQAAGVSSAEADKVFGALFITLERFVFKTREERAEKLESVSFKNNGLKSVKQISSASQTFYSIRNLDLSDNQIEKIADLNLWRNRFPKLEQIILSGNPVDSPQTRTEVKKMFRSLKGYNLQPLDAPFANGLQITPPVPSPSPVPLGHNGALLTTAGHPEFPPDSLFGQATPGKPEDQLVKEQMGLKFSYETGLKMKWVEECLVTQNFDYEKAIAVLNAAMSSGQVPADAFIQ